VYTVLYTNRTTALMLHCNCLMQIKANDLDYLRDNDQLNMARLTGEAFDIFIEGIQPLTTQQYSAVLRYCSSFTMHKRLVTT
jgi:hypothetical protein